MISAQMELLPIAARNFPKFNIEGEDVKRAEISRRAAQRKRTNQSLSFSVKKTKKKNENYFEIADKATVTFAITGRFLENRKTKPNQGGGRTDGKRNETKCRLQSMP